jgi:uncharacterized alkaline shock family protein YloU
VASPAGDSSLAPTIAAVPSTASVSNDVLARYAADAASDVADVRGLVASQLHRHRGVRITLEDERPVVELHLDVEWGTPIREVGRAVQSRVRDYLEGMAGAAPEAVNVVVDSVGPAP